MKILVTGGAGFIGSHLVEKLIQLNHDVVVIDNLCNSKKTNLKSVIKNKNLKFVFGDITNLDSIVSHFENVDIVFHLAGLADIVPSIENPKNYYNTNVSGTFNVLEACRKNKIKKIIYSASSSCYGLAKKVPTAENDIINPMYPYALTKYLGEELIIHWSKVYNIKYISFRLFNVFGTRSRTTGTYGAVFGVFLAQKLANLPLTIVGDGDQKRDFTYVYDIVDVMIAGMNKNIFNEIFNIGSGNCYSINYLAKLLNCDKIYIPKRPGEPDITFADISKATHLLKWKPKISFEAGVQKVLENINDWSNAPVWKPDSIKKATKQWFRYLKD